MWGYRAFLFTILLLIPLFAYSDIIGPGSGPIGGPSGTLSGPLSVGTNLTVGDNSTLGNNATTDIVNINAYVSLLGDSHMDIGDAGDEGAGINIGGDNLQDEFQVNDFAATHAAQSISHRHSTTLAPVILGARSNSDNSTHTAVTDGQSGLDILGSGWTGAEYNLNAAISFAMDAGTISDASSPGKILLKTTSDGATVPTTKMTIDSEGVLIVTSYERHIQVEAGGSTLGPTAPSAVTVGTARGLEFDNDAETAFVTFELGNDWAGDNVTLEFDWVPNDGVIPNGETIIWNVNYRCMAQGELITAGTVATATGTYTASGEVAQYMTIHTPMTMPFNSANQPLTVEDHCYIEAMRDMSTDTYGSGATVTAWEVLYNSIGITNS